MQPDLDLAAHRAATFVGQTPGDIPPGMVAVCKAVWFAEGWAWTWLSQEHKYGWEHYQITKQIDLVKDSAGRSSIVFDGATDYRTHWQWHEGVDDRSRFELVFTSDGHPPRDRSWDGGPPRPKLHVLYQIADTKAWRLSMMEGNHAYGLRETVLLLKRSAPPPPGGFP